MTQNDDPKPDDLDTPADADALGLTERQEQVLELVARGLSNRAIATELETSPRTVEAHVQRILDRTGCRNRAAAAAWWAQRERERE